jgi:hypothetical protein
VRTVVTPTDRSLSRGRGRWLSGRRRNRPAAAVPAEWHVGVALAGALTPEEAGCRCPKGQCGLAVPRADVFCRVHQGEVQYVQAHSAHDCRRPVWLWLGGRLTRLR